MSIRLSAFVSPVMKNCVVYYTILTFCAESAEEEEYREKPHIYGKIIQACFDMAVGITINIY